MRRIKCSCGQELERNDMGIASHLRGKAHYDDGEIRNLNSKSGRYPPPIVPKWLDKKRHSLLKFVEPKPMNQTASTQEERVLAKNSGIS